ncbi:hypothetical protein BS47DRAFT_1369721 [Hydnum rufescens UP504]|uniref:Uncharacterized protein n=1 Tax=Hydnum rufescens UP504 TaxID=1448309 RepID=A0A9P6DLM0_9AGAM|nr:hypothetical protein BS47DRAFT_1369721 [Hydnum rufescens UP504]
MAYSKAADKKWPNNKGLDGHHLNQDPPITTCSKRCQQRPTQQAPPPLPDDNQSNEHWPNDHPPNGTPPHENLPSRTPLSKTLPHEKLNEPHTHCSGLSPEPHSEDPPHNPFPPTTHQPMRMTTRPTQ